MPKIVSMRLFTFVFCFFMPREDHRLGRVDAHLWSVSLACIHCADSGTHERCQKQGNFVVALPCFCCKYSIVFLLAARSLWAVSWYFRKNQETLFLAVWMAAPLALREPVRGFSSKAILLLRCLALFKCQFLALENGTRNDPEEVKSEPMLYPTLGRIQIGAHVVSNAQGVGKTDTYTRPGWPGWV